VNILVLSKHKTDTTTQFIDASGLFKKETNNNVLLDEHIDQIMAAFDSKANVDHFAQSVPFEKVAANDYNLSVSSYVEARDNREVVDIAQLNAELKTTVARIDQLRKDIDAIVAEIEGEDSGLLTDIKQRVRHAQTRAVLAVNAELIRLYWEIGVLINSRQQQEGWGTGVIPRLARDLHNELPEEKGFSERNIKRMLAFHREYPLLNFMPQAVAQTDAIAEVPQAAALFPAELLQAVPWGHHAELMAKVKDLPTRHWYMQAAVQNGWSRNILVMQIESAAHQRQGRATSNFASRLPAPDSDLVQQTLKDPYLFDFLTLEPGFHERELETGLVAHLEKFLLALGQGFAFVGRQYHLDIGEQDFYIDLLFYHLKLRCYVVIELKRGDFKPEYAGKMNFYCSVVDDKLRHPTDQPTIGLILCQQPNRVLAEYALRGVDKPIGISSYELTRALPENLESSLPSIEQIERELQGDKA
jgi:predicted nuclease of restriction endonuclease-like (RecB) superfamily